MLRFRAFWQHWTPQIQCCQIRSRTGSEMFPESLDCKGGPSRGGRQIRNPFPESLDRVVTMDAFTRPYERTWNGKKQLVLPHNAMSPGRHIFRRMLDASYHSIGRSCNPKLRPEAVNEEAEVWQKTLRFARSLLDGGLKLQNLWDTDEVCLFFAGI